MTNKLTEQHNDSLEYVQNMVNFGGNIQMAEYQARYIGKYVDKSVKEAIADLHLERFATKEDLNNAITSVEHRLEMKITKVEHDLEKLKLYLENKMFKHTVFTTSVILITNLPTPIKNAIWTMLHIST